MSKTQLILEKYLPQGSIDLVLMLLRTEPVQLKITRPRKTKFGDYRFPRGNDTRHRISVNANLNPYAFLITLIHEMAHLKAFKNSGKLIKPHGSEWQKEFILLTEPFFKAGIFPPEVEKTLRKSLHNGAASSCSDLHLFRALKKHDNHQPDKLTVEQIEEGSFFEIDGNKIFKKGPKSRKRYRCLNLTNGREYMVHPLAEVRIITDDKHLRSA